MSPSIYLVKFQDNDNTVPIHYKNKQRIEFSKFVFSIIVLSNNKITKKTSLF